jgi:TM2 domain-containing membrane protein YozV
MTETKQVQPVSEISPNEWSITLILCVLIGVWGVHRFYVGKVGTGLLMLFTLGGFFIWWIIDLILIATESFKDHEGRKIPYTSLTSTTQSTTSTDTQDDLKDSLPLDQKFDKKIASELRELASLKDEGILTDEEFEKKKKELLNL